MFGLPAVMTFHWPWKTVLWIFAGIGTAFPGGFRGGALLLQMERQRSALRLSQTPSLGTLRPCKEESKDWDTTQNLYIEGDNLEVLKLLQKSYYGKVKMIYIDIFTQKTIQFNFS